VRLLEKTKVTFERLGIQKQRFTLSSKPLALRETIEIDIQKNKTRDNRTKVPVVEPSREKKNRES